jgi:outer membrane lipoprotein
MCCYISKSTFVGLLMALLLSGCASQVPLEIREAPADSPSLAQVREDVATFMGQPVRFGGTIISTDNREDVTWLTVLGRPMFKDGKPEFTDDSAGRFIALVPEFLDPKVYATDRQVTITGTLLRTEAGKVGEYDYTYPVVEAAAWYLWPKDVGPYHDYDPWYYDPWWYDPWYYRPWRYRGYPYGYPYRY